MYAIFNNKNRDKSELQDTLTKIAFYVYQAY